jgi:hypothetical protein
MQINYAFLQEVHMGINVLQEIFKLTGYYD